MGDPTVLHLVITWGLPSHTFVHALVTGVPGYRSVVVCENNEAPNDASVKVRAIGRLIERTPERLVSKVAVGATIAAAAPRRPAIVHAHFAHELLLARRVSEVIRRPFVVALHGRDILVELPEDERGLEALRQADAVVVPSPFLAEPVLAHGVGPERIAIIPSGVDLAEIPFHERTGPGDEGPLVVFIGRFVEKKGVLDAAAALRTVASRQPVRARFVGTGPLEGELRTALAPLGNRAEIVDGHSRSAVLAALRDGHVLFSPSRTGSDGDAETLLVVNLEAQAAGIPVLTTDHGGIPFGVDPRAAVVVPEGDQRALVDALDDLLARHEEWPQMGRAGRAAVEQRFDRGRTMNASARLYDSLRARRAVPADLRAAGTPRRMPKPTSC